ncbi:MAG: MFS transporter [Chloroflexi bacterium]|nr:MFS transporter [Chloroflexota bacterium]MDA1004340.1 MFS transporter [Chloroflexota bacterium]
MPAWLPPHERERHAVSDDSAPDSVAAPRPWAAFSHPDYRLLWTAHLTSVITQQMRILAVAQWLFEETGSAAQLGLIGVVQLVVQIPALIYGGTLADHMDRKRLMALANASTVATFAVLATLAAADALQSWHVFTAIAVTAATWVVSSPARAALVPSVVPERHIMVAVTTDTATQNVGAVLGPVIFAVAAETRGLATAFALTALLALPAVILPLLVRTPGRAEGGSTASTLRRAIEGFRFVIRHPILPGLFLLDTGITVVSFYREILPVLARGLFRGGAGATGVLGAANSAGAIVGSFMALFFAGVRAKGMLVLFATLAYALILAGFGSVTSLWLGAIMIAGLGGTDALTVAVRQATVQLTTPDHMRGRAFAFMVLSAQTANNVGTIWVGIWAAVIGAQQTMLLGAVISTLATLVIWRLWRPIREYRYP